MLTTALCCPAESYAVLTPASPVRFTEAYETGMDSIFNRREFLKKCRDISLLVCGSIACSREIAEGFIQLAKEPLKLVFIQGQNCLGCTISLTYGNEYQFNDFIQRIATLQVHPALSFNQGTAFMQQIQKAKQQGGYILVIEGSIPIGIKEACYLGGQPLADVLPDYAIAAETIICSGSCACHGKWEQCPQFSFSHGISAEKRHFHPPAQHSRLPSAPRPFDRLRCLYYRDRSVAAGKKWGPRRILWGNHP